MKQGNLPDSFPGRASLAAADINTYAQARNLKGDYSEIDGIGPARGAEIDAALLAVESEDNPLRPDLKSELAPGLVEPEAVATQDVADEPALKNRRVATVDRRAGAPPVTPDLDLDDLKSRVAFAKPRNEATIREAKATLATALQRIAEASDALDKLVHPELP